MIWMNLLPGGHGYGPGLRIGAFVFHRRLEGFSWISNESQFDSKGAATLPYRLLSRLSFGYNTKRLSDPERTMTAMKGIEGKRLLYQDMVGGSMNEEIKRVALEISGPKITSGDFARGVSAFLDVVEDLTNQISQKKKAISWVISVEPGSATIIATAEPADIAYVDFVPPVLEAIKNGATRLESSAEQPEFFSEYTLGRMRELASIVDGKKRGIDSVRIIVDGTAVGISHHTVANVNDILMLKQALGSVRGRLETLSMHQGFKVVVYDDLTGRGIQCFLEPEMLEDIRSAFGKRVSVYGIIKYRKSGEPESVRVQEYRVLTREGLPSFEDVKGILKD